MTIENVRELLNAQVLTPTLDTGLEIETICGSDMMSDVLAFVKKDALLLTGLTNPQVIRTADMMDINCICFIRGKSPSDDMVEMAEECGIFVMQTDLTMYNACGKLYEKRGY